MVREDEKHDSAVYLLRFRGFAVSRRALPRYTGTRHARFLFARIRGRAATLCCAFCALRCALRWRALIAAAPA